MSWATGIITSIVVVFLLTAIVYVFRSDKHLKP